ncbi:xylulose kinase-1 [Tanacetum coccineum]
MTSSSADESQNHPQKTQTQNIQQIVTTTVSNNNAKFPYLKKDEYETWAMKMEYWIMNSEHLCECVLNMNAKRMLEEIQRETSSFPPVSAEEQIAIQRETKARTLLLQSLPEDYMAEFHHLDDARDIWLAIKARYRGGSSYKSNHSAAPSHSAFVSTTSGNNKMSYAETSKQSSSYISASPGSNVLHFNSGNVMEDVLHTLFEKKARRKMNFNNRDAARFDKKEVRCYKYSQLGHFARECTGKQVESNARYSAFKIKELELDKPANPKALLSVDSMVNWLDHEESANENASQVMAMIVGPRMDEDKKLFDDLEVQYKEYYIQVQAYKNTLNTLEQQKAWYQSNQLAYEEKVKELQTKLDNTLARFAKWKESSKNLAKLVDSSMTIIISFLLLIQLGLKDLSRTGPTEADFTSV